MNDFNTGGDDMIIRWRVFFLQIFFWTFTEIVLNGLSLSDLADYSE